MSSGAEIVSQVGVGIGRCQSCGSAAIAIFANDWVDSFVFSKLPDGRRKNDEVCPIRQRHAGSVDCLVYTPGGMKFMRIEIDDSFVDWLIQYLEIHLQT